MRFSLRRWITTILLTSALFGLTFNLYSGGFTPNATYAANRRGNVLPGKSCSGDVNQWGLPFTTFEVFDSYLEGDSDGTYQRRAGPYYPGIALNLMFWFMVSFALATFISRRISQESEP